VVSNALVNRDFSMTAMFEGNVVQVCELVGAGLEGSA
jgi:hypothetical protein